MKKVHSFLLPAITSLLVFSFFPALCAQDPYDVKNTSREPKGATNQSLSSASKAVIQPELRVDLGHAFPVGRIAISHDGRYLATGSADGTVCLWDIRSRANLRCHSYGKYPDKVDSLDFSPSDNYLLVAIDNLGFRPNVYLWDMASSAPPTPISFVVDYMNHVGNHVNTALFVNDTSVIVASDSAVGVWDMKEHTFKSFEGAGEEVYMGGMQSISISRDGRYVVAGGAYPKSHEPGKVVRVAREGIVRLWRTSDGKQVDAFQRDAVVTSVALSRNGDYYAIAREDSTAELWDRKNKRLVSLLDQGGYQVTSIAFDSAGQHVVTSGADGHVRLWDSSSGKFVRVFRGHPFAVYAVTFFPGDKKIVSSGFRWTWICDVESGLECSEIGTFTSDVLSLAFSRNSNRYLLTGSSNGVAHLWDLVIGRRIRSFKADEVSGDEVSFVTFSPDDRFFLTTDWSAMVKLWDVNNDIPLWSSERFAARAGESRLVQLGRIVS